MLRPTSVTARGDNFRRTWVGRRRGRLLVAILGFTGILAALMQTIVVPLIADLPALLSTTPTNASWVITATLLSAAITTPISGRLGDMFGKRRMLLVCVALLTVGSVVCAMSSYLPVFLVGRVLQGAATSVIPLGISILRDELRPHRVSSAIALVSATLGAGASIALPLAAFTAQRFDWHLAFWAVAVMGVLAFVLIVRLVPKSSVRDPGRFDAIGAVGLGVGLLCLLLPVTKGSVWGWGSPLVLMLFAAGIVVTSAWVWYELRSTHPLVDIAVSASRPVLLTNIASILCGFAMFANYLVLPQLLQAPASTGYGLGQSMVVAGLCMAPGGLVMMLLSPVAGSISTRFGPKVTLLSGLLVISGGYVLATFLMSEVWHLVLVSAINGAGVGLAYGAMPALIMAAVPASESAAANGLNTLARSIGTSMSSAVMALVLTGMSTASLGGSVPTAQAFQVAFVIGALAAAVAAVVAYLIPTTRSEALNEPLRPHAP